MNKKTKKIEEMATEFKENIEDFTETMNNLMEKINSYMDTTNKMTMIGSLSNYPQETQKFKDELQKFGLGVFLWFEKDFPKVSNVYKQCGFLPLVIKIKDIKKCIDEYNKLINEAKQKHKDLTELEIKESKELFNNAHFDPIKILTQKSHLWRKINDNTSIYIDIYFKTLPAIEIYTKILTKVTSYEMAKYKVLKGRRGGRNLFKLTEKTFKRINKEFYKKCPENIKNEIQELGDYGKGITNDLDYIKEHKKEDFYNLLELSKDLYEFHIDFIKYILRIWHIYKYGNRDYANNYKIKHQFPNIKTIIKHYINQNLIKIYPNLSRVLKGFFLPFEKYRHIESHSTPNLELSDDENYIFIPQKGRKSKLKVNISEFKKSIITYQSFIEALRVYH